MAVFRGSMSFSSVGFRFTCRRFCRRSTTFAGERLKLFDAFRIESGGFRCIAAKQIVDSGYGGIPVGAGIPVERHSATMGGWAIEMLDADPHVGDSFRYENIFVIVAEMNEERVKKLTVLVEEKKEAEETVG